MGVPKLISTFTRLVGKERITLDKLPLNIATLWFDLASIIHQVAQKIWAYGPNATPDMLAMAQKQSYESLENEFHQQVINLITIIIQRAHPTELVYIAMDGTVPAVKSVQQRQRRFFSAAHRSKDSIFDSNAITAGTAFLQRLSDRIDAWLEEAIDTRILPPHVIFSSPREPGEGEHKIANVLRAGEIRLSEDLGPIVIDPKKTHVIHGLDTDLLFLALLSPQKNIYLWREQEAATTGITPEEAAEEVEEEAEAEEEEAEKEGPKGNVRNGSTRKNFPPKKEQFFPPVVSITKIKEVIAEKLNGGMVEENFVVLMSLLGNDFIPRQQSLEDFQTSIPRLIDLYNKLNLSLVTEKRRLDWKNILKFMKLLAEAEPKLLLKLSRSHMKNPPLEFKTSVKGDVLNYDLFSKLYYEKVMANERMAGKEIESGQEGKIQMQTKMVAKYIEVINFVFIYYSRGVERVNKDFFYNFHYAPLFRDVLLMGIEIIEEVNEKALWRTEDDNFLHPYQMLVAVLPLSSSGLYPSSMLKQVQKKIATEKVWASKFPRNPPIRDVNGFFADYAGPVLIPFLGPALAREIKVPKKYAYLGVPEGGTLYIKENEEAVIVTDPWDRYLF